MIHHHRYHERSRQRSDIGLRAASNKVRGFTEGFKVDIAQKANRQGLNGEAFAQNLVAGVVPSVCQSHFEGLIPSAFNPEIIKDCVASTYDSGQMTQPALHFLAIFEVNLLCGYVVSET